MMHCGYFDTPRNDNHRCFPTPTLVGGRCPLPCQIFAEVTRFEKRRLRPISAVSTVRDSEKSSINTNIKLPRTCQRAIDRMRTLPLSPERVAQKAIFRFFWNKSQLQSNKVCYKVSLCEKFHQQSCSTVISLSNGS